MQESNEPAFEPLASFPIASTNDPEEARGVLTRELVELRFGAVPDRGSFHFRMNGVQLGRTWIGYNRFDADTLIDPGRMEDAIVLALGIGPATVIDFEGDPVVCTESGAIISPERRMMIHRAAGSEVLLIRTRLDSVHERFREVTGRSPRQPILFDKSVNLASGIGAHTSRLLNTLIHDVRQDPAILDNPLLRTGIDDLLLSAILALPNNYSEELREKPRSSVAPRTVRLAEEYMEAHAPEPITVPDLVALVGTSRRSLFNAFRRFRGYTPMQFLTNCRLRSARESLQSPGPLVTVTSVSHDAGFSNAGRFAAAYRRRFGEGPSETLRRARIP